MLFSVESAACFGLKRPGCSACLRTTSSQVSSLMRALMMSSMERLCSSVSTGAALVAWVRVRVFG